MNQQLRNTAPKPSRDKIIKMKDMKQDDAFSQLSKSDYSLRDVLNIEQFRQLSKQIQLRNEQEEKLVDSFYQPTWKQHLQFERTDEEQSYYSHQYRKWKGEQSNEKDAFKSTYQSTLALLDKQKQKEEVNRLIKQYSLDNALFSYSQNNPVLTQLNQQYSQSLEQITKKPFSLTSNLQAQIAQEKSYQSKNNPVRKLQQESSRERQENKEKLIELQVQKQLLQRIKRIDEKERKQELKMKKQRQLKKTCFVDLIQRPPSKNVQKQSHRDILMESSLKSSKNDCQFVRSIPLSTISHYPLQIKQKQKQQVRYKLNINEILMIPHRQFLIFYSENYHQIVRLSTPEELKRINQYRNQAISRQQAVEKLKKKVAQEGSEMINKLPSQMKQKLFKILYEKDIEQEAYYQSK